MVLFFISTLAVSIAAMVLLLALKRYELASGRMVMAGARPGMNSFFQKTLQWAQQILPSLAQQQLERAWKYTLTQTQRGVAYVIVTVEHTLERILNAVRSRTDNAHPSHEPSAFLREVADHKKTLLYKKGLKKHVLKEPAPRDTLPE